MKILIINFEYPPLGGGGGVATRDIAEELAKRHKVHVLTTKMKDLPESEVINGVEVHRVKVWGRRSRPTASVLSLVTFAPRALLAGWKLVRNNRYDVINAQFVVPSGVPASILAKVFKIPMVLSFIGGDVYDPTKGLSPHRHWWMRVIVRWVSEQAVIGTAISADTRRRAIDIHGVTKEIVVTHLGLRDYEMEVETVELDQEKKGIKLVTIGRLIPRKGYESLLRAIRGMDGVSLDIIGSGPLEKKLLGLTAQYDLEEQVRLLGYVPEKEKIKMLKQADVYVSAAEHEGFGIVFLEAMEQGLPIVTTDNGGQIDFLSEENALIVKVGDTDQLTRALIRMRDNVELRGKMAIRNKVRVKDFYLPKTTAVFEEVLKGAVESNC